MYYEAEFRFTFLWKSVKSNLPGVWDGGCGIFVLLLLAVASSETLNVGLYIYPAPLAEQVLNSHHITRDATTLLVGFKDSRAELFWAGNPFEESSM